jgi:hypothetical protein
MFRSSRFGIGMPKVNLLGVLVQLIHFDIKPANVLLDHAWSRAKISDVGEAPSHLSTMRLLGTNFRACLFSNLAESNIPSSVRDACMWGACLRVK